ncbi:MAG TPA: hypothetical protein VII73_09905 [Caulobacteraceae bacterium]
MEIHKPEPWRGWRGFLKEYGIVVLGVMTALAAGQAVEAWHYRQIVSRGEEALRDNFARFIEFRVVADREAPCLTARADQLRAILDAAGRTRRLARVGPIPQPVPLPWQIDTWEAVVGSGAAPYLPQEKAVLYSRIAMSGVDLYNAATQEWEAWHELQSLSGSARAFSEAEEAQARDTLARAVGHAEMVRFFAKYTVWRIERTHLLDRKALAQAEARGLQSRLALTMCQPIVVGRD